jgi:hypothetical protein
LIFFINKIKHNYKLLKKINIYRNQIDLLTLSTKDIKKYYSDINSIFLNTVIGISKISDISIITRSIVSYSNPSINLIGLFALPTLSFL